MARRHRRPSDARTLPRQNSVVSAQLITLATFDTPIDAEIAKNKLEAAGVRAFLADEATVRMASYLGPAMGGVKLQVRDSDVELALSVLESDTALPNEDAGGAIEASEATDESTKEREEVDSIHSYQRLGAILLIFAGGVILIVFFLLIVSDILSG